ncbi:MAG: 6-phosphofructokinase [Mycoplasma sp.]|nr:6-phosphofructokinase [Mycoplasma sp.]
MKKIAILTSGGDAPGMNAATRAIAKTALIYGMQPYVVFDGFKGLVENKIEKADIRLLDRSLHTGGTIIYSARLPEFSKKEVREIAVKNLKDNGIDALVVIGGDGSYKGAQELSKMGILTVGLPGTIDNDISSTDYTIGFFTALETIIDELEKIRSTAKSHKRAMIVEVMGRYAGDLALYSGISTRPAAISSTENKLSEDEIASAVKFAFETGRDSAIIIVTEKLYDVHLLAKFVEQETGISTRGVVLGHVQRGGKPSAVDRILGTKMGIKAVQLINDEQTGVCVIYKNGKIDHIPILDALAMPKINLKEEVEFINELNKNKRK